MTLSTGQPKNKRLLRRAFTLLELVLVLVLLTIIVSLVMPTLKSFFSGRMLDAEVRRFVSLTHYAQSRAVSDGIPMVVWVDVKTGTYGLQQEAGYTSGTDDKAVDYAVDPKLTMKVTAGTGVKLPPGVHVVTGKMRDGLHFSPDGNIITGTSLAGVSFQQGNMKPVWVKPSADGLSYEVQN